MSIEIIEDVSPFSLLLYYKVVYPVKHARLIFLMTSRMEKSTSTVVYMIADYEIRSTHNNFGEYEWAQIL